MLHVPIELLCGIIDKSREFQAKEAVVLPDSLLSPSEDWALQILADHGQDYCLREIAAAIGEMSERQRAELIAIMWIGRGDYVPEEWEQAVGDALGDYSIRAATYLLAHPMISDHLEEGLLALGYSCQD
ncbi:MAG: DUF3775 domain-containing protein [Sphingobacteriia bacterium]|nr:DUF3775 domain-containing protein [Sphingobacteriia bacterium]NCC41118.1 DUF3775 domain-containing protein [Gammaproteobacteria bacterium]